eukprot:TRINITY_DN5540_c0_g1_i1.p1 TRINITY_DN5540_c0_g1~~TRINITY_DN5540_c0_g1_i1.p1  ORF type:complete len:924 (+),score=96.49 TRINITY_DN5540_c0_g1_i1:50-2773(+)
MELCRRVGRIFVVSLGVLSVLWVTCAQASILCEWSSATSGQWSNGPWAPTSCQNSASSNVTVSRFGSYRVVLDVPASVENVFVSNGPELALQSTLQLSSGGLVDVGFASNISFEFAAPNVCSRLTGEISIEVAGRMKITCADIIGTTTAHMRVILPNIDRNLVITDNGTLFMKRVDLTIASNRPISDAQLPVGATWSLVNSSANVTGPVVTCDSGSLFYLFGSALQLANAGLETSGVVNFTSSTIEFTNNSALSVGGQGSLRLEDSFLIIERFSRLNLINDTRSRISTSRVAIGRFRMLDRAYLELVDSNILFGDTVVYGSVYATEQTNLFWSEGFIFEVGSALSVTKSSRLFVNGTVGFRAGSIALITEGSSLDSIGAFFNIRGSTVLADLGSNIRVFNGSILIRGCSDLTPEYLSSLPPLLRPCSLFINGGSTLRTDTLGNINVVEGGLVAAQNGSDVHISSAMTCGDTAEVVVRDASTFTSVNSIRALLGCSFSVSSGSRVIVRDGQAVVSDSALKIEQSNYTVLDGSLSVSGTSRVSVVDQSQLFIGNLLRFSSENETCNGSNCTLSVETYSRLATSGTIIISDGSRLLGSTFSEILILQGNLLISRRSAAIVSSSSELAVNGTAVIALNASIQANHGVVTIRGSVSCRSEGSGIFLRDSSRLRVGGSIDLSDGCVIVLSSSLLSANLGNITTDNSSAIFLNDRSVLSGTGVLDATVYSVNSTIGGPELTDIFIKTLNLSSSSTTVANISAAGSTLKINSTTALIDGQLTITIQTDSLPGLKSGSSVVLISSSNMTGNFSSVTFIVPAGEQQKCYKVQQDTKSLAVVFSAGEPGCEGVSGAGVPSSVADISSNTAVIVGGAVGGAVALLAVAFVIIVLAVPSVRVKIFPFTSRNVIREDTLSD